MIKYFETDEILGSIKKVIGDFNHNNPINLHEPFFRDTDVIDYLNNCISTGWVSSSGNYVKEFEKAICEFTGSKFAIVVNNGTVALRLMLYVAGVRPDDEVLIPPLSFVATANAVSHLNANPHFIDIDKATLGLCPLALHKRLKNIAIKKGKDTYNKFTGKRISAIIPVHVFGNPATVNEIVKISNLWDIPVLEDAAEALGSWSKSKNNFIHCGLCGDAGIISFNGNKIITTGGGGALITNNETFARKADHLSKTAKLPHQWEYFHDELGWNDRMPNINAALGVSQMKVLKKRIIFKRKLAQKYQKIFSNLNYIELLKDNINTKSNNWLLTIKFLSNNKNKVQSLKNDLLKNAHKNGLLIRPAWKLLHKLPMYIDNPKGDLVNAEDLSYRLINLPSSPQLIQDFV